MLFMSLRALAKQSHEIASSSAAPYPRNDNYMKIVNPVARLGEDLAVEFLQKKGYTIIERNFRKGYGEIDIIAIKDNTLVFVEVKTRRSTAFGTPLEAITPWKLRDLVRTAEYYKHTHKQFPGLLRIDAISVALSFGDKKSTIEHVENISV